MRYRTVKYYKSLFPNAFLQLRELINRIDPVELLDICPPDEYDPEVAEILDRLHECETEDQAAEIAIDVFERNFSGDFNYAGFQQAGKLLLMVKAMMKES